ncbi:MAG: hypothetical protein ABR588_12185 [Sphingomicrobium sp.]|nr:hypothetical protein [Sphingomonadales bacterium]
MDDIDRVLAKLAGAAVPPGFDSLEARVLARIGTRPSVREARLGTGLISAGALALGMIGAGLPASASAISSLAPLVGGSPLAPSTLLAGAL